jgi:hypothetical protein
MKWNEALDFAEKLISACEEAKKNAEKLKLLCSD